MVVKKEKDFLGTGWKYPIDSELDVFSNAEKSIEESIIIIIMTQKGERVMRPDFGCDIHKLIFSSNVKATHLAAERYVKEALTRWEPRITIDKVKAARDPDDRSRFNISLTYTVKASNSRRNLVYPFFIQ